MKATRLHIAPPSTSSERDAELSREDRACDDAVDCDARERCEPGRRARSARHAIGPRDEAAMKATSHALTQRRVGDASPPRARRMPSAALLISAMALMACSAPPSTNGETDAGPDLCREDRECDDGLFCDGRERCLPGASGADEHGCVAPAREACIAAQQCDEDADRCVTPCDTTRDADGDGHDAIECGGDDCDDGDSDRFPGNLEVCDDGHDEDCDPRTFGVLDADGDGSPSDACCNGEADARVCGTDCDDGDPTRSPSATEACNALDDDCDGSTDEGVARAFYPDLDGDGFGDAAGAVMLACSTPAMASPLATDCDDTRRARNPGAPEICDTLDNDCDGLVDEDILRVFFPDADGDGFGDPLGASVRACTAPAGYVADASDCDDTERTRRPGGVERCNAVPDEDCDPLTHPFDADHDGYDDAPCGSDCAPADPRIHPFAPERCNGVDDDCSEGGGVASDEDVDRDGYVGVASACTGGSLARGDCDDASASIRPGAVERCNGVDDDCDGSIDDSPDVDAWCAAPFATTACTAGACAVTACDASRADCDGSAATGCEADTSASPLHCGGCGNACGVAGTCVAGTCARDVVLADRGAAHACAVRAAGGVACWGDGSVGQRGDGRRDSGPTPTAAFGIADAVAVAAGEYHTCILRASGGVACAGLTDSGRLGNGDLGSILSVSTLFVDVVGVDDAVAIAAGAEHTCALRASGAVVCWGSNGYGQLGDGTTTSRAAPVAVPGIDASAIFAGANHTCAIVAAGAVECWGKDDQGQLGDGRPGSGRYEPSPVAVPGLTGAVSGAGGLVHSCVVLDTGGAQCWGSNGNGQLGDGTTTDRPAPAVVRGVAGFGTLADAVELDAGDIHTCVRRRSGALACWGANFSGQLGIGITSTRATFPVAVPGIADAISVTAGLYASCTVRANASVLCWGDDVLSPAAVPGLP